MNRGLLIITCGYRQKGMTLIELMISLLLGTFLIGGFLQVFVNARQTHIVQEELSKLQDSGRFAIEILAKTIRLADYRDIACFGLRLSNIVFLVVASGR